MKNMITLVQREFIVDVPLEIAWQHLGRVEQWPSWAKHIKRVELDPPGEITPTSKGAFHLSNGMKAVFQMTEFNLHRNWKWVGTFLWMIVEYDHRFEAIYQRQTRIIFVVDGKGFGVSTLGRLFALIYNRNLNAAIPRLIAELVALNR